jgi:hypothetical protein
MSDAQILTLDGGDEGPAPSGSARVRQPRSSGGADEPEELVGVDELLAPGDVLSRIENVVASFLENVAEGRGH